jgi:primosomal protein N' (replication factor Y) (superfamily II helicase)
MPRKTSLTSGSPENSITTLFSDPDSPPSEVLALPVAVAAPAHSDLPAVLSYSCEQSLPAGSLVRVPLGSREVLGIVWDEPAHSNSASPVTSFSLKPIEGVLSDLTPLSAAWRALMRFSARYYQRSLGEVALAALPPQLRELDALQLAKRLKRKSAATDEAKSDESKLQNAIESIALSPEQSGAIKQFFSQISPSPALLYGSTGSGKTEVYLRSVARVLQEDAQAQVLVMVPEINLTPQLQERFTARFAHEPIAIMHSGMTPAQRLKAWLLAHSGQARIILGTRMSIFASMPHLALIVVDEEHDASYKSQDGARHSARDLAVMRAKLETEHGNKPCKVMLGSATPSVESWQACEAGRYQKLEMPSRIGNALLPKLRLADMRLMPRGTLFAPQLIAALQERITRGEQSLVFLNRRGYAPVLACDACGWKCECPHCSAYRVFHKSDRTLRCHHCGHTERVPRACPECGNIDIQPVGRGTQKIEEQLAIALGLDAKRPDGQPIVITRIDADTTRHKGELEAQLAQVHAGDVDILVGTQMITKGHDFRRITLVAAIDADAALFSSDFRAPERLFALLMQAAGRAGRDAASTPAHMWVQTRHPDHPLFASLAKHDYPGFAKQQLKERAQAQLPPFSYQALLRAEARTQEVAQAFLQAAQEKAIELAGEQVMAYPPVPMSLQRVADVERAQMLLESASRASLQGFLSAWLPQLRALRSLPQCKGLIRFAVDVDPLLI